MARGKKPPEIQLGLTYRDKITGYVGVAVTKQEHLNGCIRWVLEGRGGQGREDGRRSAARL